MIQTKADIREIIRKNAQFYNSKKDIFTTTQPPSKLFATEVAQDQGVSPSPKRTRMEKQKTEYEVTRFNLAQDLRPSTKQEAGIFGPSSFITSVEK